MRIRIPRQVLEAVRAHAERDAPDEACGVLIGRFLGEGDLFTRDREVVRAVPTRNAHAHPRSEYVIDPGELLRAAAAAEAEGLDVVGFYHSHPEGPAHPSATDTARAAWPGASYFLVWLTPEPGSGAWRWDDARGRFVTEEMLPT